MKQFATRAKPLLNFFAGLIPAPLTIDWTERVRACFGMFFGILLTGVATRLLIGETDNFAFLVSPIGASAIILFALPSSPLAKPWPVIGGNVVSAIVGIACAYLIDESVVAAAVAATAATAAMLLLRCLHPPGCAMALTAVLGGPVVQSLGFGYAFSPVALNCLMLVSIGTLFNMATRRLPIPAQSIVHQPNVGNPPQRDRLRFSPEDLDAVLDRYNELIDVDREDLEALFIDAERQAYRRRFGEISCREIMSTDVVTVEFGTSLEDAWALLHRHHIKALPVIDRARRVTGIVTEGDFVRHAEASMQGDVRTRLSRLVRRTAGLHADKPEVVGQIMTRPAATAHDDTHIIDLVPLMIDRRLHYLPIVDAERRIAGIVTQSDLIVALYQGRLRDDAWQVARA